MIEIHQDISAKILDIPYLRNSIYSDLDIRSTLEFFNKRYVQPLAQRFQIDSCTVVDCGTGYGWFSFAYILAGGKRSIAVDLDEERLEAAGVIAKYLNIDDRIQFINSAIQDIQLPDDEVELFVSIETLEHIGKGNISLALKRIKDITSQGVLITTPNALFPVIAHDTRIPFIHWLPSNRRRFISRLFHREHLDRANDFVSPFDLNILLDKFRSDTTCLTFRNIGEYLDHFPIYQPYGHNAKSRWQNKPANSKLIYYRWASTILGTWAYWIMPSLTCLFIRRQNNRTLSS